jgi:hypothetical protein
MIPRLALAGIVKHLLSFFNGIDHDIAAFKISAADQYHAIRVGSFRVFVIDHLLHSIIPILASSAVRFVQQRPCLERGFYHWSDRYE